MNWSRYLMQDQGHVPAWLLESYCFLQPQGICVGLKLPWAPRSQLFVKALASIFIFISGAYAFLSHTFLFPFLSSPFPSFFCSNVQLCDIFFRTSYLCSEKNWASVCHFVINEHSCQYVWTRPRGHYLKPGIDYKGSWIVEDQKVLRDHLFQP